MKLPTPKVNLSSRTFVEGSWSRVKSGETITEVTDLVFALCFGYNREMRLFGWIVVGVLGLLSLFWLSQTYRGKPFVAEFVEDQGRSNRLELIRVPVGFSFNGSQGFDVHS